MENKKSIYEYIESSIQKNGMLSEDFNLDVYMRKEQDLLFDLGAYDGMLFFMKESDTNKAFVEFVIKLFKTLENDNIPFYCALLDNYITEETEDIRIIDNMDSIIDWIIDNQDILDKQLFFKFATAMMFLGRNTETVKLGIIIWGTTDVDNFPEILDSLLLLATCDEFTFFVNDAIGNAKEANNLRFKMAKKVNGWGKIFTVGELEPENDSILEWLITQGCDNNIDYSYLAYPIAQKIDLEKVLRKEDLTEEEFLGLSKIIIGLLNEEHFYGISRYKNSIELLTLYIKNIEEKYSGKIEYYKVPIEIAKYYTTRGTRDNDDEINLMLYLKSMFALPRIEMIIISALNSEKIEDYKIAMSIIEYYNKKELYDVVYQKFNADPIRYFLSFYYLMQNRSAQEEIVDNIISVLDSSKYSFEPTSLIGINDNEAMAMTYFVSILKYYPLCGIRLLILGLRCNSMYPRNAALNTIEEWMKIIEIEVQDFPDGIYDTLLELSKKEVIKTYKEKINKILNIDEDLSNYKEPRIELYRARKPNIYEDNFDSLFEGKIIPRGKDYYESSMILSCNEKELKYTAFVQGNGLNNEYEVNIECNRNGEIKSMNCTCPYPKNCKHEYAVLKYIYRMKKGEKDA